MSHCSHQWTEVRSGTLRDATLSISCSLKSQVPLPYDHQWTEVRSGTLRDATLSISCSVKSQVPLPYDHQWTEVRSGTLTQGCHPIYQLLRQKSSATAVRPLLIGTCLFTVRRYSVTSRIPTNWG
ncbi:hypothetical protein AVEN_209382-1 [Araneus ventricosus]|uniref:Uncharacterized protein n=1 Tax=Araneus ventricosus TaxID=182803 RepID=A0A4Y2QAA2_ARAVE|nr:hypothetical protein AVEN_236489-1 [Araneus ventricosus]GBN59547.1 hypothetical protein AVEN_209382-1 [Araneus ventricosus]